MATNNENVPMIVVRAMRNAFVGADHKTLEMQIGMLRAADRNLDCEQTRKALLDCIVASLAPPLEPPKIDWLNARFIDGAVAECDKWVELALHVDQDCSDDLIRWLVFTVDAVVTERALEYACSAYRWNTVLPVLLSSNNIQINDDNESVVVMRGTVWNHYRFMPIMQLFEAKGYTLQLGRVSWVQSALAAYRNNLAQIADLRAILEPMLYLGAPSRNELNRAQMYYLRENNSDAKAFSPPDKQEQEHVAWMNRVLARLPCDPPVVMV